MKRLNQYIIYVIIAAILFFFIWFFFIYKIKSDTLTKGNCFGNNCIVIGCSNDNCVAGYCVGESCNSGNCFGENCIAGDCYGYDCKPGVCLDPNCPIGICPQSNKNCLDGRQFPINRQKYFEYTKNMPYGTVLNPPLCSQKITVGDLRRGRGKNIGIQSVNVNNIGKLSYNDLFLASNIKDKATINTTYPYYKKDSNCRICIGKKCEK
jgi:hypothetical protein